MMPLLKQEWHLWYNPKEKLSLCRAYVYWISLKTSVNWVMEIMKEQKLVYLTRRQLEVAELKKSLEQNSFELAQVIGHRLKGHGETFGFPQISQIGITMEKAAKEHDIASLKEIVNSLDESVEENLKIVNNT